MAGGPLRRLDNGPDPDHLAALCDLAGGGPVNLRLLQPQAQRVREELKICGAQVCSVIRSFPR